MNKGTDALSRLDYKANSSNPVDEKFPTVTISITSGPSQIEVVDDDKDLLPTWQHISDIDA